jgi:uncharacterized protein
MRSLLDVNVLIALLDDDHTLHDRARDWFEVNHSSGWASCPLSQNAFVRISSNPGYSTVITYSVSDSIEQLRAFIANSDHHFWPDEISLLDGSIFASDKVLGSKQLTDLYLLALAAKNGGRLVTFDTKIPISAIRIASQSNLSVI